LNALAVARQHLGSLDRVRRVVRLGVSIATSGDVREPVTTRLPGRGLSLDVATLTELLRETETRHGGYEPTAPKHHWSGWYAGYIVSPENGKTPDEAAKDAALHIEGARDRAPA
jgi:hypothetical protein